MADSPSTRSETTLRDFLNVLFKWKYLVLSMIAAVTVLVFLLNATKPLIYESASRILVRRGEQSDGLTGSIRYLGWAEEVSSQIQVILSDDVFRRAGEMFADSVQSQGMDPSLRFNAASVRADVVGESNAFVISYVSGNKDVCQLGCEVMTLAFQDYYKERKQPPELTDFFAAQIADVREELESWQTRRNQFLNKEKFYGATQTAGALKSKMDRLDAELLDLDREISVQQLRVENLRRASKLSGAELEEELAFSTSQGELYQTGLVQQIKFKLQNLRLEKEDLEQKFTDQHPDVKAVNLQIEGLLADLERQVENAFRVAQDHLTQLEVQRKEVVQNLTQAKVEWDQIPDRDRQLTDIDNTIASLQTKLDMLLSKQAESEIAVASRTEWEVDILSHAGPPFTRRTRDYVRMALGPMLALVVAMGVAFFLESLDHSLKNIAEVEEFLDTQVLATISEFKK
jgi:uncharacterized protein involved in exopolysaccharide biosynthesis